MAATTSYKIIYSLRCKAAGIFVIILLMIADSAFSQTPTPRTPKFSKQAITLATAKLKGSLFIVDGKVFTDSVKFIKTENIATVNVLKGAAATAIYGAKGVNDIIIVTTKKVSRMSHKTAFFINEVLCDSSVFKNIDPDQIEWIGLYKTPQEKMNDELVSSKNGGIIEVYTKPFLKKANNEKLISFSDDFKAYVEHNADKKIVYNVDGKALQNSHELYELKIESISTVNFDIVAGTPTLTIITKS